MNSKPQKPRLNFPLTAHDNGQWCKWIKPTGAPRSQGRLIYFGPWADPTSAEAIYTRERDDLLAGREPRATAMAGPPGAPDLEEIADRWLVKQEELARQGMISPRSYLDKKRAVKEMFLHWRKNTDPMTRTPDDFGNLRRLFGDGVGPSSQGQRIIHIRAMFRWAGPDNQRLLPAMPHWGDKFRNVSEAERIDARDVNEKLNGERKFILLIAHQILREVNRRSLSATAQQAAPAIVIASRWFFAANLIAANMGAYADDIAGLARDGDVDLTGLRWIDKKRGKTSRFRVKWQAPLWPETIAAILDYLAVRPAVHEEALQEWRFSRAKESQSPQWKRAAMKAEPMFLTAEGFPLVHQKAHHAADGELLRNTPIDSVGQAMGKFLGPHGLNVKTRGLNFGAWRHTFTSIAEETGRDKFVKRITGHAIGKIETRYFKPTVEQLRFVTDHVRSTLLPAELRIVD
jgi:hypothetical protein